MIYGGVHWCVGYYISKEPIRYIKKFCKMGADGGTINKSDVLKLHVESASNEYKAKDDNLDDFQLASRWKFCKISNLPLRLPIVSDYMGNLYNKESILEWILCKDKEDQYETHLREQIDHIKKIHDVVELNNLCEVRDKNDPKIIKIKCKFGDDIFGDKMKVPLVYSVECGDVFPEKTINMNLIKKKDLNCPVCIKRLSSIDDIIPINPLSQPDIVRLEKRYKALYNDNLYHDRTRKKRKKRVQKTTISDSSSKPQKKIKI